MVRWHDVAGMSLQVLAKRDVRVGRVNELLAAMKLIKGCGWEGALSSTFLQKTFDFVFAPLDVHRPSVWLCSRVLSPVCAKVDSPSASMRSGMRSSNNSFYTRYLIFR